MVIWEIPARNSSAKSRIQGTTLHSRPLRRVESNQESAQAWDRAEFDARAVSAWGDSTIGEQKLWVNLAIRRNVLLWVLYSTGVGGGGW